MMKVRKLFDTLYILACLFCARMFGQYVITYHLEETAYHSYYWRGEYWHFPLVPNER